MKRYELKLLTLLLVLFTALLLVVPLRAGRMERVAFRRSSLQLEIGQRATLRYILEADSAPTPQFSSDAPLVASVDQNGIVTAVSPGTARMTLTAGERLSTTMEVVVAGVPVTELSLDASELTLQKGQHSRFTALVNSGATDKRVFWSVDDPNVVTVDDTGLITAVGGGATRLTATTPNGLTAAAEIFVQVPAEGVSIQPEALVLGVHGEADLDLVFEPADATERVSAWESTDESVLSVTETGRVTALAEGTARVRLVTASALAAYADVTVEAPARGVELVPNEATVARGTKIRLETAISPEEAADHYVSWRSDAPEIVTVEDGVVSGLAAGKANITAVVDGVARGSCAIVVRVVPEKIVLNVHERTLSLEEAGQPLRLTAQVLPEDAEDRSVTFSSDNEVLATVDAGGIVTFTGANGTATITAETENGLKDTCTITVLPQ